MSNFPASISLTVDNTKALRNIGEVERALQKASNTKLTPALLKAEKAISDQLDLQAQKYAAIDRIQRQLLANDNSRIKANEKLSKTQQFIQDKISVGRAKQASAAIRGDQNQYPTTVGPTQDFAARNRAVEEAVRKTQRITAAEQRLAKTRADAAGRQSNFIKLQKAESKAKLTAARDTSQAAGEQAAYGRVLKQFKTRLEETIVANQKLSKSERDKRNETDKTTRANKKKGNRFEGLALGAGFPLLFGGGIGQSIAGLAGAAAGPSLGLGQMGGGIAAQAATTAITQAVTAVIDLGQALNPLTADVDAVAKAAGKSGTAVAQLIQDLNGAGLSAEALALATAELEQVIGKEGVDALQDFGAQFARFTSDIQVALTRLQAFAADLYNTVIEGNSQKVLDPIRGIAAARNDPRTTAPVLEAIGELDAARGVKARLAAQEKVIAALETELSLRKDNVAAQIEAVDLAERQAQAEKRRVEKDVESLGTNILEFKLLEAQLVAAEAGVKLTDEKVYLARQAVIEQRYENELIVAGTNAQAAKNAEKRRELALRNLDNSRDSALTGAAGSTPKSKALQLEQQITQEELKQTDLTIKRLALSQGEKAALQTRINLAQAKVDSEVKIVELQRQQALESNKVADDVALINEKYDAQLQTLLLRNQLDKENYEQRLKALALEEKMAVVKGTRAVDDFTLGADRQLEDISMQMANPFGGDAYEQLQLQVQQTREYDDRVKELTRTISDLNDLQADKPTDARAIEIQGVQNLLSKYRELTPAIFEAQQQQLKLNQTMEMLQPVTSAIASGMSDAITGVIDGTKSVEEAMSEMFANIGKAFIDMATQMIAQALIMKALNILMPGASGGGASDYGGVPGGRGPEFYGPAFDGGGYTGSTPRSGGVDGKGGFPAILHPQETVIDHTKAMSAYGPNNSGGGGGGGGSVNVHYDGPTLNFNQDQYLPVSAVPGIIKQAASAGEKQTMNKMRYSPAARRRAGI